MKRLLSFTASVALLTACSGGGTSAPAETLPTGALVVTAVSGLRFDAESYGPVTAGSVVLENTVVESGFIYAGSPARKIKPISEEQRKLLEQLPDRYVMYSTWFE